MSLAELQALREMLARRPPIDIPITQRREQFEALAARFPLPDDLRVERVEFGRNGLSGAWVRTPAARPDRVILYLHGGAFSVGSSTSYRELAGRLGRAAEASVFLPDFRLAPEHPLPAAHDDAFEAYCHLLDVGYDPSRLAVAGDSSGANLAVSAVMQARTTGMLMPAAIGTISAYLDLTNSRLSIRERDAIDPFIDASKMNGTVAFVAPGRDPRDPRLSPLFADLAGLPPILLLVGEAEVLHDDSVDFAAAARAEGVDAHVEVWPQMVHVWPFFGPMLEEGRTATVRLGDFLKSKMRR